MGWRGYRYWSPRSHLPMYTLRLPFVRLYVVNSPRLVQIVQKQVRTISFAPILVRMASTAMGVSQDAAKIISENHLSDDGFVHGVTAAIRPSLSPGPKLNALNRSAVQIIAASLDKVARHPTAVNPNLVEWVYRQVMIATMEGVYGPLHPFRDPDIQKAFLGFVKLMINILPALTARKSVQARNAMRSAFRRYFDDSAYEDLEASPLIKAKQGFYFARGIANEDMARMEVTSTIALLSIQCQLPFGSSTTCILTLSFLLPVGLNWRRLYKIVVTLVWWIWLVSGTSAPSYSQRLEKYYDFTVLAYRPGWSWKTPF
ncbi:hypothetical protein F4808DRAFT_86086 [Astrocystis sublimbata]|nr:hypothetical protein F4808DRAFT_86086 [Astrocystis sublimbata]